VKQGSPLDIPAVVREREQHDIEPSRVQPFDEPRRQILDQVKPECGIGAAQLGQNVGQQEWADGRDHTHPQASAERLVLGSGGFRELFAFLEYSPCPFDDFEPERGQYDPALGAVDKRCLEDSFQFLYAGTQRRLRDVTRLRGPAKVAVTGEQDEML
jgi:hypothetical protein